MSTDNVCARRVALNELIALRRMTTSSLRISVKRYDARAEIFGR
jgi:hypothetical protein